MTPVNTFLAFALLTLVLAAPLFKGPDGKWTFSVMTLAWLSLFPLLIFVNGSLPFAGGGDDNNYFYLASRPVHSLEDAFDLTRFRGKLEQPAYAVILSIIHQFTEEDLLAYKQLNLATFILLIPLWYRIGVELDSRQLGRTLAIAVAMPTPLWYYWMFLLKDIAVTLLQGLFLLGALQVSRRRDKWGAALVLGSTLGVMLFRSQLVLLNTAVLAGMGAFVMLRRGQRWTSLVTVLAVGVVIAAVLGVASDAERMASLGIYAEDRIVGAAFADRARDLATDQARVQRTAFPLQYLLIDTSGMRPDTWTNFDPFGLRGILALPWIYCVVPFFLVGLVGLLRPDATAPRSAGFLDALRSTRLVSTPWGTIALFIVCYMVLSWTAADTTRWRIPDMPAIMAVAGAGWLSLASPNRLRLFLAWGALTGTVFALYYLTRA